MDPYGHQSPGQLVSYALRLIHGLSESYPYPEGDDLYRLGERIHTMRGSVEHKAAYDSSIMQILQDIIVDCQNVDLKLKSYNLRVPPQQIQYDINTLINKINYLLKTFARPASAMYPPYGHLPPGSGGYPPYHDYDYGPYHPPEPGPHPRPSSVAMAPRPSPFGSVEPIHRPSRDYPDHHDQRSSRGYPPSSSTRPGDGGGYGYNQRPNRDYPASNKKDTFEEVNPAFDPRFKACTPTDHSPEEFLSICSDLGMKYNVDDAIPGKIACAEFIREKQREARGRTPPTTIVEARTAYTALSAELLKSTNKLRELYQTIPEADRTNTINEKMRKLEDFEFLIKNPQCKLVVFGETNAGKSLFMNLLLEYSLLPSLGCAATSSVTELTYSEHGTVVVTNAETSKIERIALDPNDNPGQQLRTYLVAAKEERAKYQPLVKIEWPSNILRAGITLVDSPGINENPELDEIVKSFLPDCSGVLCVLDSSSNGFSRSIQQMLSSVRMALDDHFNPSAFLFVCSKIDRVPERDREQCMKQIKYNLTRWFADQKGMMKKDKMKLYPDFNAEEQTIFLNVFTSFSAVEYGLETVEYQKHKKKITSFIEKGYYLKFQSFYNQFWEYVTPGDQLIKAMVTSTKRVVRDIEAEKKKTNYKNAVSKMSEEAMRPLWLNIMREKLAKLKNDLLQTAKTIEIPKLMEDEPLPKMSKVEDMQVEYAKKVRERWKNEFMIAASKLLCDAKKDFGESIASSLTELYTALKNSENSLIGIKELWVEDIAQEVNQAVESAQYEFSNAEKAAMVLGVPVAVAVGAAAVVVAALLVPFWAPIVGFTLWSDSKAVERAMNNPQQFKKAVYELVYTVPEAEKLSNHFYENSKVENLFYAMLEKGISKMLQLREDSEQLVKKKEQQSVEITRKYKPLNTKMDNIQADLYFLASILDEKLHNGKRGTYIPMRIEDTLKKNTKTFSRFQLEHGKFPPILDPPSDGSSLSSPSDDPESYSPLGRSQSSGRVFPTDRPSNDSNEGHSLGRSQPSGVRVLPTGRPSNDSNESHSLGRGQPSGVRVLPTGRPSNDDPECYSPLGRSQPGGVRVLPDGSPSQRSMCDDQEEEEDQVTRPIRVAKFEQSTIRRPARNERDLTRRSSVASYKPPAQIATTDIDFNGPPTSKGSGPDADSSYGKPRAQSSADLRSRNPYDNY